MLLQMAKFYLGCLYILATINKSVLNIGMCVDVLENIFYSQISTCLCIVFVHVSFFMVNMGDAMHAVIHFVCFV